MSATSQVKPVLYSFLLLIGLAASGTAMGSPLAKSVVEASPIDEIVAQYPQMMSEGIRRGMEQSGQAEPLVISTVTAVVRNAFSAADIKSNLVADLSADMSEQQLNEVRDWYRTPLAKTLSKAEIEASRPQAWSKIEQGAADLQSKYRGSERSKLFDRFDRASRATESAVDTGIAVQLGLMTAISAFQGSSGPKFDQLKQSIEGQRDQMRAMVAQQVYDAYLYMYQDVSVDELERYVQFMETDEGARFTRVATASIQRSITEPVETVGRQLARFLSPQ